MTTFSYIVRTADQDQLEYLSLVQQSCDLSIYEESKRSKDQWVYSNQEFLAMTHFVAELGEAMSDRYRDLGPYWDDYTDPIAESYYNPPTNADLWVCTDLFEGYDGDEDVPF